MTSVSATGIHHLYGKTVALRDVSFEWPQGVIALIGANGAGKSTLLELVARTRRIQSGSLTTSGDGVGFVPQDAGWPQRFTVDELLTYAAWWHRVPRTDRHAAVSTVLELLDLRERKDTQLKALSGGMRRRALIGTALIHRPQLVILDEPGNGLDPAQRHRLGRAIRRMGDTSTVVVSSHLIEDLESVADWVCVLHDGSIAFNGTPDDLIAGQTPPGRPKLTLNQAFLKLVTS